MRKTFYVLILVISIFVISFSASYAVNKDKILIYPFESIKDTGNYKISYSLSLVIADKIKGYKRRNPYIPYVFYPENFSNETLFPVDEEKLAYVGETCGMDIILYGYYSVEENGKVAIYPKIYYPDREFSVDIDDSYEFLYKVKKNVESMNVKKIQDYKPKKRLKKVSCSISKKENLSFNRVKGLGRFSLHMRTSYGIYSLFGIWGELYNYGVFNEISLFAIPERERKMSITAGVNTRYSVFSKDEDYYTTSVLTSFFIGPEIEYRLKVGYKLKYLTLSYSAGFSSSALFINNRVYKSFDPTDTFSFGVLFGFAEDFDLTVKLGYFEVLFLKDTLWGMYLSASFLFY